MGEADNAQHVSREVLAREIDEKQTATDIAAAIERGFQRLQVSLSHLVGEQGFWALVGRAVYETRRAPVPLQPTKDPQTSKLVFEDLVTTLEREGFAETVEGSMTLLSNFVDLLSVFLGQDLTRAIFKRMLDELERHGPELAGARARKEGGTP